MLNILIEQDRMKNNANTVQKEAVSLTEEIKAIRAFVNDKNATRSLDNDSEYKAGMIFLNSMYNYFLRFQRSCIKIE